MVDGHLYAGFVLAVSALMLLPGPNVALIVANSVAHGMRYGLLTVAGTSCATALQLGITALGMTELLGRLGNGFEWLRWAGVCYLLWLGVAQWRAPAVDLTRTGAEPRRPAAMLARAFLVSLTNPKTLLFYGAFFPQFLAPDRAMGPQFAVLGTTLLALALLIDSGWAVLAGWARHALAARGRLRNRLSGGLLIGAGLGLAAARRA